MIDTVTKQPLKIVDDSRAGPYVHVPATQIDTVLRLLQSSGLKCWQSGVMSVDGRPAMGFVYLGRNGNARAAQSVLDSVA
jgi:hypothetical protein